MAPVLKVENEENSCRALDCCERDSRTDTSQVLQERENKPIVSSSHFEQTRQALVHIWYSQGNTRKYMAKTIAVMRLASLTQPHSQHIIVRTFLLRLNCDDGIIRRILLIKFLI